MSLVRWIRKNNRKIMVFVVIFSMVSFVIGYTGLTIISNIFSPAKEVIARYDDGQKLRPIDLGRAQSELTVLRMLMSEQVLASQGVTGALLSHLLFPDSKITGDIAAQLKQAVLRGQVQISLDELEAYFSQPPQRPEVMWILLKAEAYRTGFIVSDEDAKRILRSIIPQLLKVEARVVVEQIISRTNLTEEQIIRIFRDLLTVVHYANAVMDNEAVTLDQIKAFLGRTEERLDAEYVKIDAAAFVDEDTPVSEAAIEEQFEAYKENVPTMPTEENPFGFGYKLPKRIQVEYIIVLTDDVKSEVEPPTAEAMEDFYSNNIERYQTSILSDPNNPDSERITQTRPYAEVESQIRSTLENEKASNLANMIFNAIKDKTEAGFEEITFDDASEEQLQMAAGDYQAAAQDVSDTYNVPLITGKTGWLSPSALNEDEILGSLSVQQQQIRIRLPELLLNVAGNPQQQTHRIGMPNIRIWQNIGPIRGGYYSMEKEQYYQLMAMVRVIGIKEAAVPESVNVEYDTKGVVLFDETEQQDTIFSLKEKVKEDVLLKNAMATAKARAAELAELDEQMGWDKAIDNYNEKYAPGWDPNEPQENTQAIEPASVSQQTRASQTEIAFAKQYIRDNPAAAEYMQQNLINDMLNNRFYDMLPEDAESTGTIHEVLVFEPQAACYVVKNVTRQPATISDYLDNKAITAMQLSRQDMASLALVHFSPENILKRMDYTLKAKKESPQAPVESVNTDIE